MNGRQYMQCDKITGTYGHDELKICKVYVNWLCDC